MPHASALTEEIIDTTPPPERGFVELRERGLALRIYATGLRSWSYEYRSPSTGQTARIAVAAITLAEARTIAERFRVTVKSGRDPRLEKQDALIAYRTEHARKLPIMKAMRWARKNGADVTLNPDGSYSFTFKPAD